MQNQDMQFADPEWRPPQQGGMNTPSEEQKAFNPQPINVDPREQGMYGPQPFNPDPREQRGGQALPQQEGRYAGPDAYADTGTQKVGGQQFRQRQSRRRSPWLWVILVLIALALLSGGQGLTRGGFNNNQVQPARQFTVGTLPTIVINDDVGVIHVHTGGAGNDVTIQATKVSNGFGNNSNDIQVNYNQDLAHNTITVDVGSGFSFLGSNSVNLDVTVPTDSNLQLKTDTGEIDVSGVTGQMSLTSDTGTINATQDSLDGQSILKTDTGTVRFDGAIDPNGSYQFEANTGTVDVTLPANSSFHLDASTDTGSINSDFSGVSVQHTNFTGASAHGDVGNPPRAAVTMKTDTGSIDLHQGP